MPQEIKLSQLDKGSLSGFIVETTSGEYYPTGNPSGFVDSSYVVDVSGDISGIIVDTSGALHTEIIGTSGYLATSITTTSGDITGHITSLSGTLDDFKDSLLLVTGSIAPNYEIAVGTSGNLDVTGLALSGFIAEVSGDLSGIIAQTGSVLNDDFLAFQASFRNDITGEFLSRAEKGYTQEVSGKVDFKQKAEFGQYGLSITGATLGVPTIGSPDKTENIFFVEREAGSNCYGAIDTVRTKIRLHSGQDSSYLDEGSDIEVILGTFIYSGLNY
jgi:hypothetical protein